MMSDDLVTVWTTAVNYTGGTVAYARGETEDGEPVEYVGEPRALYAVAEALESGELAVLTAVPTWALLRRPIHLRPILEQSRRIAAEETA